MQNLYDETAEKLQRIKKTTKEIRFIGSARLNAEGKRYSCTWDEFRVMADRQYDAGYGGTFVALDLIILFKDGSRLYRHEYDGSEGWAYSNIISIDDTQLIPMTTPFALNYDDLTESQQEGYWTEVNADAFCPTEGCNNLKDTWDKMCDDCYEPIRAKEREERMKHSLFHIKHKPIGDWNFEMTDEALDKMQKLHADGELLPKETLTTDRIHCSNTFLTLSHHDVMKSTTDVVDKLTESEEE